MKRSKNQSVNVPPEVLKFGMKEIARFFINQTGDIERQPSTQTKSRARGRAIKTSD
jgi:hypothetical protein